MSNEEYKKLIKILLDKISETRTLERIYNFVNNVFVGRGQD